MWCHFTTFHCHDDDDDDDDDGGGGDDDDDDFNFDYMFCCPGASARNQKTEELSASFQ